MNAKERTYKTIFAIRVMMALRDDGIEPLFETDNRDIPGFKCWVYEVTSEFEASMNKIMGGK